MLKIHKTHNQETIYHFLNHKADLSKLQDSHNKVSPFRLKVSLFLQLLKHSYLQAQTLHLKIRKHQHFLDLNGIPLNHAAFLNQIQFESIFSKLILREAQYLILCVTKLFKISLHYLLILLLNIKKNSFHQKMLIYKQ